MMTIFCAVLDISRLINDQNVYRADLPWAPSNVEQLKLNVWITLNSKKIEFNCTQNKKKDQTQNDQNHWNYELEFDCKHF